jgi:hypothetical protein
VGHADVAVAVAAAQGRRMAAAQALEDCLEEKKVCEHLIQSSLPASWLSARC